MLYNDGRLIVSVEGIILQTGVDSNLQILSYTMNYTKLYFNLLI